MFLLKKVGFKFAAIFSSSCTCADVFPRCCVIGICITKCTFLSQNQLFFGNKRLEYQNTTTICGVKVSLNYYCGKGGKQRIFREQFDILCEVSE